MEHRITHACGHQQDHYIPGFLVQQERKARWLRSMMCRECFLAAKRVEEARTAVYDAAMVEPLAVAALVGSERQVGWASGIRARQLAALVEARGQAWMNDHPCLAIADAKWWIDHRDLVDDALLAAAEDPARASRAA